MGIGDRRQGPGKTGRARGDIRGELGDGRRLKHAVERHVGLALGPQSRDKLDREQRVAAEIKEVIVDADRRDP